MSHLFEEEKNLIINEVVVRTQQKLPKMKAALCSEFVRQFYLTMSLEDLKESSIDDLFGLAVNFWDLMEVRNSHAIKVKIYNPNREQHGWESSHTVIELICQDMSFLVDSLRIVLKRMGISLYLTVHMGGIRLLRDANDCVTAVLPRTEEQVPNLLIEAPILMKIERQTDPKIIAKLEEQFQQVLTENRAVIDDWTAMRERVCAIADELQDAPSALNKEDVTETQAFLHWLEDHHFTFIGMQDYDLVQENKETRLKAMPGTGMGILRDEFKKTNHEHIASITQQAHELMASSQILIMSKTDTLSCIHRDTYMDYIGIKRFDKQGQVIGERRILGLYTSVAYNSNPVQIPFLRHKLSAILRDSHLNPRSHAGRILLNIMETLPRDDLIQSSEAELLSIGMGIYYMQERRRIRMFARVDVYHRFISCLVYVPKDVYNADIRNGMQTELFSAFHATDISFTTYFPESSIMARVHFMVRIDPKQPVNFDFKAIETKLVETARSWLDDLHQLLVSTYGTEKANALFARYKVAIPTVYKASFSPRTALMDISHIEQLSPTQALSMSFYRNVDDVSGNYRFKLYQHDDTFPLSDVLPIVENLGMRAISERPYVLKFADGSVTWVNDFSLHYKHPQQPNIDEIKDLFQQAFASTWFEEIENDGFNQLVLLASMPCRQVAVLRMYAKYFKQIGFTFSQEYIEKTLLANASIAKKLFQMFEVKFNQGDVDAYGVLKQSVLDDLEKVTNLDEDKIIRQYVQVVNETLRTNYYQKGSDGKNKSYISIKLNSKGIPGMPRPYPLYEIFVYSIQFEAVHLRSSAVARGGLRWSDRREDFRTEVLGLMKAQQVKNAVIVPNGAKGGFVVKQPPALHAAREDVLAEGVRCYQEFIRGLLDITDNYVDGEIKKPLDVICYDANDPYLVVAADKGTATFSDIANEISLEYGFWLGDAFASGGSQGYDHKKIGITARGAWESVHRHFNQLGLNPDTTDFTVIGIGDMSGDVFGNGMLLSQHIKLVAAFNHIHLFIDPSPNAAESFVERQRLFHLPRSTWEDYDRKLISQGGGVFNRSAKSIPVSPEMKALFGLKQDDIEPNELLKIILKTKVDLLWSAGIGTFVKGCTETHADVGDRTNDLIRINGKQVRARSVVEGGNLGFTQLARVEYALSGGLIYTDFIDNSAGVSCSDKEVNIKILLNHVMNEGDFTENQRNKLLSEMTDEVAHLVLRENYLQTRSINLSVSQGLRAHELNMRCINELHRSGKLDRHLEYLPDDKQMLERKSQGKGLTSSEVATLMCYNKILLKEAILASDVPEDPYLKQFLIRAFPVPLQKKYADEMQNHPLKREIIATGVSNLVINEMGFGFVYRLQNETGSSIPSIVRAYIIARDIIDLNSVLLSLEALDTQIKAEDQMIVMTIYVRLLRRIARWFLNRKRNHLNIEKLITQYKPSIEALRQTLPGCLGDTFKERFNSHYEEYLKLNIPDPLALELTRTRGLFVAMEVLEIAQETKMSIAVTAEAFYGIGQFLDLGWLREQIIVHPTENNWEALSREALRDDFDLQQRQVVLSIFKSKPKEVAFTTYLPVWAARNQVQLDRWTEMMNALKTAEKLTFTMFFVAVREFMGFDTRVVH
ncbi:MAG: NAD-glutamate dehydrogenase [Gammaproteobacteria bacterium]|nr:NAD-glutamate dehydrogenase [Gammaproteobacteria bacterium]